MEYTFTLKYQLAEQDANHDELVERLGAAGCDDALVGTGQPGRIALEFVREAESAEDALSSALSDVKSAIPSDWHQLDPNRQQQIIMGINLILQGVA